MKKIDAVLGIMDFEEKTISEGARQLLAEREAVRAAGQWREADMIRQRLSEMGIEVSDTSRGVTWRLK